MATTSRPDELQPDAGKDVVGGLRAKVAQTTAALSSLHQSLQREHRSYALLAEIVDEIRRHNPDLLAKQAAYSLLYAVPSVLIMLIALATIVDRNTGAGVSEALRRFIAEQAPPELQPLLESLVRYAISETSEQAAIVAAIVSFGIAIWGGSGGVGALIYAINEVYDIRDTRPFVTATLLRLGLMLFDGVLVVGAFILLAFGRHIGEWLVSLVGRGSTLVELLLSGPVWGFLLLIGSLLILYWFAPDIAKSFRWIVPGAVAAALAIAVMIALLDWLLTITNPGAAYGAAGSVLILLWALFLVSQFIVIGAIINAVLGRHFDRTLRAALRQHPEKRRDHGEIAVSVYR